MSPLPTTAVSLDTPADEQVAADSGAPLHSGGPQSSLADVDLVCAYLRRIVVAMLEDSAGEPVPPVSAVALAIDAALSNTVHRDYVRKFIGDPQTRVVLVERVSAKEEEVVDGQEEDEERELVQYMISNQVRYTSVKVSCLVFIKLGATVDAGKSLASQMQVATLSDGSPYETLHTLFSNTISPFFKSYVKETGKSESDGDKMATSVEKKVAELEMGLLHLQQNIDIPEINLQIHPCVAQMVKKCRDEGRRPQVADFGDRLDDSSFLNQLQNGVNRWIREIQKVTRLDRDPSSGTAIQEISFWLNLERALLRIQEKRDSTEVALTMDILRHGKRFHATISFDADTGLKHALATVNDYQPLMKDFPINELLAASELDHVRTALRNVFHHLRKIRNTKYSLERALRLVEAISRDLLAQLLKLLGTRRLMHMSYDEFDALTNQCAEVFVCWDDEYDKVQGLLRDLMKKKHDHVKMTWRIQAAHKRLQARMDQLRKFRHQHEQLRTVIVRVMGSSGQQAAATPAAAAAGDDKSRATSAAGADPALTRDVHGLADVDAIDEVNVAYDQVKDVDSLDISKEGVDLWEAAISRYEERINRVETRITARLRDQLGTAKNANEMFRIFSRFNALLVRPHVRGAIREYQTQLITRVKEDIESLHEKFKVQYQNSSASRMSHVRDVPPVAGSILWARQIDHQLSTYMRRVEDVLGRSWENHVEGQKLKADSDSFRMKLNTAEIFEEWAKKVQMRNMGVSGLIFAIDSQRSRIGKGSLLKLKVNFLPEIITLSKEVRNLKNLGFRVPLAIVNKAHTSNQVYPFAISLIESVRTYERTLEKMDEHPNAQLLVASLRHDNHAIIAEGVLLIWESYKLDTYVRRFADSSFMFQEKVDLLLSVQQQIDVDVKLLDTCCYSHVTFAEILGRVQKAIDDLSLQQYSNLTLWVSRLDDVIAGKLALRLEAGVCAWTRALRGLPDDDDENHRFAGESSEAALDAAADTREGRSLPTTAAAAANKPGGEPVIAPVEHELRIVYNSLHVHPPLEEVRCQLLHQLFAWQNVITNLSRIQSSRYHVGGVGRGDPEAPHAYKHLLKCMPNYRRVTADAYQAVEEVCTSTDRYVQEWLAYQKLWDLNTDQVISHLNEDIVLWMNCVEEMKKRRSTFDTSETKKSFGPVVIDYGKVQSKVSLKYDAIHKDILGKFGALLGTQMGSFHTTISKSRGDMELQSIEAASTSDAVTFITYVQSLKRQMKQWQRDVELYKSGQRVLERHRFQFPAHWLHVDNIDGEWSAFNEIIRRKDASIQAQVASLQMKIVAEDKVVEQRTGECLSDWDKQKPVEGHLRPADALQQLQLSEARFQRLKDDRDNVARAKEALELGETGVSMTDERLTVAFEELNDLKGVWSELSRVWERLDEMKDKPWLSVQPRKVRQELDSLLAHMKQLPTRLRQYSSYEYVKRLLQSYTKVNMLVVELKSDTLKERHWTQLQRQLRVRWQLSELTLGQIWDVDLLKNEAVVKEVILVAQGEMALEEFIKQVKDCWQTYQLDLINYQNKCKLIRGWDDLFAKVKEHTSSLAAMKLSPYYKVFEEDALAWEDKLNRIDATFDVWIVVQRRWVYLEGLFSGSSDIKALLPVETSRFASISTEFLALMKKVNRSSMVLDVLGIQGVMRSLERLADLLGKIQKALGEYLERERSSFPRFYFVGDEDLLEIIGNSKNIPRLQKHFKKMFAGVSSVLLDEQGTCIRGVASASGEEVLFAPAGVPVGDNVKINEWLSAVESSISSTLAAMLASALASLRVWMSGGDSQQVGVLDQFMSWCDQYPAQIVVLALQVWWSEAVEAALAGVPGDAPQSPPSAEAVAPSQDVSARVRLIEQRVETVLNMLADAVLQEQPAVRRVKLEHLVNEFVHKRSLLRAIARAGADSARHFVWLQCMRFYWDERQTDPLLQLSVHMANARFQYGFEYLGVQERLVQTPLTDRCYLTMTQALQSKLGGSPFGPAGTGKTESVKALGHQLGKFVLVFNCDETFDVQAMGRIFLGLCQVGAWGCFDEFNRLEERMLSAVSQQIQTIQEALRAQSDAPERPVSVELVGRQTSVSDQVAIFITMNPGYAGRSNLPDNLKKLFRSLAMTRPNLHMIAQVTLFSQGFRTAERLAGKIVPLFQLCSEQLSTNSHYDFSLRALKSVLASAGSIKRARILKIRDRLAAENKPIDEAAIAENLPEQEILIQSVCETMVPKLVAEDIPLLFSLLSDVFPGVEYQRAGMTELRAELKHICQQQQLVYDDASADAATAAGSGSGGEAGEGGGWVEKVLQLYQISQLNHGLMMVGPSGSGKSTAWRVLLQALERLEGVEGVAHVIDPKAISKEALYGVLDPNTREWSDGLFTHTLRKIIDNVRGEISKRQWIVFDGDVDPEWVENLNSVLDNNKLLTLPNGERLAIPPNVRIMFEVENLKHATPATVSRCGMIWFSEDVLSTDMIFRHYLGRLCHVPLEEGDDGRAAVSGAGGGGEEEACSAGLLLQRQVAALLRPQLSADGLVVRCMEFARSLEHIMDFTRLRALTSLFSMLNQACRTLIQYNSLHADFPLTPEQLEVYVPKALVHALLWSFSGDGRLKVRDELGDFIRNSTTIALPAGQFNIIDYDVTIEGEWAPWAARVPKIEVETHMVAAPDVVVPTVDTMRHESLLYTWLADHKPLVLCGPPGSGKTMTLLAALRALPDFEVVGLNFSSATTPELMFKTFDHYCEYRKTPSGVVLAPVQLGKWLVIFCDEINLPDMDSYGTQRVISFLRQLVERGGFYRRGDHTWVQLERIQFVGACNPPTDPGRKPLSHRFLRHVPVVYVDYPGEVSLKQIYGTFVRAMLRMQPSLKPYAQPLTAAMVEFYLESQSRFTQDMQPHYVYSPRELTRWVRGICEALQPLEAPPVDALVRLWAHEALRLFHDRLVHDEERQWTNDRVDSVALKHFPNVDCARALQRPILYSNWLHRDYVPVQLNELRDYVRARLKVFYEEELDVPLVLFNEVLDHVLRIDRIYRQPQGHLLLIGVSGAGKTTLSRFVAWLNGLSVFQIKVHNKYSGDDFDDDLRHVLRRSGCKGEKLCFILDESNMLDSGFLERMNTLLANGEVPGLFDGDEFSALITQCKEGSQRDGLMLDSNEELYKWFTSQVIRNLHVVFTMNPSAEGLKDRAATSPALFNRCVLNWFGDWSCGAYFQVGREFTVRIDLDRSDWQPPDYFPVAYDGVPQPPTHRDAIVNAFVHVHNSLHSANQRLAKRGQRTTVITPRHYLDFISHFVQLYTEKCADLEEQQLHLNVGLAKIAETVQQVEEMQRSLADKSRELQAKNEAANQKLKQMVVDQQEAERQKVQSQEIQQQLRVQTAEITKKREDVLADLSQVEPAVIEAQNAVKSIKKQHLVELRTMANPPMLVRLALESICLFLGEETSDWKTIRGIIMKDSFIPNIVNYSTEDIADDIREKLRKRYFSNPDYSYEKINKASSACGPMVKWAIAQINFADMLKRVEPLRNELNSLESQADGNKKKAQDIGELLAKLEKSIANYKEEYALLIAQAQAIKSSLSSVQAKVDRSMALLKSLSIERTRWLTTSDTFRSQMLTIVGDVLLSAAFLAYAGYFDQQLRHSLFTNWCGHLQQAGVQYRPELARTEYLSSPDQRLRWQASCLPADELCTENAIMLHRFNRYPLIIDPSGQAADFIANEYADRKITKTSFLDASFRKNLESSLRFGNPLLVQDVENYDPILNPVLNRELRRTGGRVLITIGDQDIDLSPSFTIFLCTRDPTVEFPADICSRVTFVNFTVTPASLQAQCLNQVLKNERPDIDEKRSDMLKLQGEFRLRLRHLEKSLLQALNDSKGKILDDDTVITTLETLKREASDISTKVEETDKIIAEIDTVSQQYMPLSLACSSIYFTLDSLHHVHFLYQFSLHFFLDVFTCVLQRAQQLPASLDAGQRLQHITGWLFCTCYQRVARGMLHSDCLTLALLLTRIRLRDSGSGSGSSAYDAEFEFLLRGKEHVAAGGALSVGGGAAAAAPGTTLSADQLQYMTALSRAVPIFANMQRLVHSAEFLQWLQSDEAEQGVPQLWRTDAEQQQEEGGATLELRRLLVLRCFRSDRFVAGARRFVSAVHGDSFLIDAERQLPLAEVVQSEVQPCSPVLLCAVHGYDASGRVDDLVAELGCGLTSIAIGSAEGFSQSERAINSAVKTGRWVMLKNVHLAPAWLVQLEKKLHALRPHSGFRLFLTMEISPRLPVNLLRAGRVLVFEPPPGIRANLLRTFSAVGASRMMRPPSERARIYFLLAWFHAVVQERVRYAPLGWSKPYEFTESDLRVACDTLDTWIDATALGRTNLPPEKVPWTALHTLLAQCVYGGKIDNEFDQRLLSSLLCSLFSAASFDADFALVEPVAAAGAATGGGRVLMPEGIRRDQFVQWAERLAEQQSPAWLGLPANAERLLLAARANHVLASMLRVQLLEQDDEEVVYSASGQMASSSSAEEQDQSTATSTSSATAAARPAWMRSLHNSASSWRQLLPQQLQPLRRSVQNIRDPLYRFFEREVNIGARLLVDIQSDLDAIVAVCAGARKQTNHLRHMVSELVRGVIPASWRRYSVPHSATVMQFITDFARRARQLQLMSEAVGDGGAAALRMQRVWLGGLFNPEAYVTATRQCVAQNNGWSLEELSLSVTVCQSDEAPVQPGAVAVCGLALQGATCRDNQLQLGSAELAQLPLLLLSWLRASSPDQTPLPVSSSTTTTAAAETDWINLPVYLDSTRAELLFTIDMRVAAGQSSYSFYQRGVALIASTALN